MGRSILDDLGEEVTGIAAPVSICMILTITLVRLLNPDGDGDSGAVYLASIYYTEEEGDSAGKKLSGSVINALIFVGIMTITTFIMVLLFKYGYTKIIYGYLGFSGFSIFFLITGIIIIQLLQKAGGHMDWFSFSYILFNFAAVGSVTLFFTPAPLLLKQSYLVITGVVVAFVFTWIPEWTTWVLLVAMALYDVVAVLVPGGPLKMLVELAQERDEDIPALVYEARRVRRGDGQQSQQQQGQLQAVVQDQSGDNSNGHAVSRSGISAVNEGIALGANNLPPRVSPTPSDDHSPRHAAVNTPLIAHSASVSAAAVGVNASLPHGVHDQRHSSHGLDIQPLRVGAGTNLTPEQIQQAAEHPSEASAFALPEAIKLGLGDFIFYSVLVGRAAMYDMLTVFSCYIAIISGLGLTLLWLAVTHHALPALPISIALAVVFYFVSRFVMEPVILPMNLRLVFF